jgi:hypothetical protein
MVFLLSFFLMPPALDALSPDPTQVSGHEFTHAAKAAQKINSLLPQARGPRRGTALAHAGVEARRAF